MKCLKQIAIFGILALTAISCKQESISIDLNEELNHHADQVGVWVNPRSDKLSPAFIDALKILRLSSIRYGWQYGVFDKSHPDVLSHSPCDIDCQGYLADDDCTLYGNFGPGGVEDLCDSLDCDAYAILSNDGILYSGESDLNLKNMNFQDRTEFYVEKAVDWAQWSASNQGNFKYFEIGNACDIPSQMNKNGAGGRWKAQDYARVAEQFAKALRKHTPQVKCGINGGLNLADETREWFKGIYEAVPDLNAHIDFVVYHRYEFLLDYDTWKNNSQVRYGYPDNDLAAIRKEYFPDKPVYVTEIGSWKSDEEKLKHYRAMLNCEMLGNIFLEPYVELAQHWPTTWDDGIFYAGDEIVLTSLGKGLLAYTKFAQPVMVANAHSDDVRYFAAKDPETNKLSLWLINHSEAEKDMDFSILNYKGSPVNEQWRLTSPDNDPHATTNSLWMDQSAQVKRGRNGLELKTKLPPSSITIVYFSGQASPSSLKYSGLLSWGYKKDKQGPSSGQSTDIY